MGGDLAGGSINDVLTTLKNTWSASKIAAEIVAAIDPTMKAPEAFAPSGTYPVTYDGAAVEKGDTFRITSAGTMGAVTVNVEDLLIALIDTPAQVDANWMVAESNRDQATETVKGVAELATQAEADAGTNDTNIVTPLKMANAPLKNDIIVTWDDADTINNNYVIVGRFAFRGTTILGTPTNIKAVVVMSGANPGDIKIFDVTNSLQIVEKTGISNTTVAIIDLGALSNLPTGEAMFELQLRVPAVGAVSITVDSLGVFF